MINQIVGDGRDLSRIVENSRTQKDGRPTSCGVSVGVAFTRLPQR